jgi:hypothetical protein
MCNARRFLREVLHKISLKKKKKKKTYKKKIKKTNTKKDKDKILGGGSMAIWGWPATPMWPSHLYLAC